MTRLQRSRSLETAEFFTCLETIDKDQELQWSRRFKTTEIYENSLDTQVRYHLQWSRSLHTAEIVLKLFDGRLADLASMKPQSGKCGNRLAPYRLEITYETLQLGRSPTTTEMTQIQSRTAHLGMLHLSRSIELRKYGRTCTHRRHMWWLQWGRSLSTAEIDENQTLQSCILESSMEPPYPNSGKYDTSWRF